MKLTETQLRNIVREELQRLTENKEIYKANFREDYYRDVLSAIRNQLGEEMVTTDPDDYSTPIRIRYAGRSYKEITVSGRDLAQKVQEIANQVGANIDLAPLSSEGGPYEPEKRTRGVDGPAI